MTDRDIIKAEISKLKEETHSILLSSHSTNDSDFDYWYANFKGFVLDPFIEKVNSSIDNLPQNSPLLNKIDNWIDDLKDFKDDQLKKIATHRNIKHQASYIDRFISFLTNKRSEISSFLDQMELKSDVKSHNTDLSRSETILLMLYLQEVNAIYDYSVISNEDLAKAFSMLCGYSQDQMKKIIAGEARDQKNQITSDVRNFNKLKTILSKIIDLIDRDIRSFAHSE